MRIWFLICAVCLGLLIAFAVDNPMADRGGVEATPTPLVFRIDQSEAVYSLGGL